MKRILHALLFLLCSTASAARETPMESVRLFQSGITAIYFPSFSPASPVPFFDNFNVDGYFQNLFSRGPNLNFYWGYSHSVKDNPVMPAASAELSSLAYTPMSKDLVYGKTRFAFLDYFQLEGRIDYLQNGLATDAPGYDDYRFQKISASAKIAWDWRYSSLESWVQGMTFLYPEAGTYLAGGLQINHYRPDGGFFAAPYWTAFASGNTLFHFANFWTLSFSANAESHLAHNTLRSQAVLSKVVGTYEIPGDYAADGSVELRFLHPSGIFWESPEIWILASFLFKFSPGFLIGYNAGVSGNFGEETRFLQSVNLSPMTAVRVNGELKGFLRFDLTLGSSQNYRFVLGFYIGGSINDKPGMIGRVPFN